MGSAPMIALSPSGCPPPRLPPTPHRHSCESRNPSLGRGMAPPRLPLLGTRVRGHDVVPPPFLRKQESIPGTRGMAPARLPLLGTRVRGHDDAPPSFLRKQESIPAQPPPWVPASAGTTWFHRHSCESRNPSPSHLPPLGTRLRGHDVVPPSFLRKQESIPGPTSPFWVPASAGTTWFHRLSCEACPRGNGEQESIPAPPPPSGYPRPRARRGSTVIPAKAGIQKGRAGMGTRVRGHDVVPPPFLRSLSSWKRGAGIHPHNRTNSPCKSAKIGLQIVDKAKAFAIPFRAVIP